MFMRKCLCLAIIAAMLSFGSAALAGSDLGQSNALRTAMSYLSFTAFSYEGLIDQLEYEQDRKSVV